MTALTQRRAMRRPARGRWTGRILLLPALLAVAVIGIYPLVYTLAVSLTRSSLGVPFQSFVGTDNLTSVLTRGDTIPSMVRSLGFAIPSALLAVVAGLAVALALHHARGRGRIVRAILLLPLMTPPVMAGVIGKLLLAPTGGTVNNILRATGLATEPVSFLGTTPSAMLSLVVTDAWQWTPLCMLLIYAALQTLPSEVYEAAQVDGASPLRTFRSVTLPLLLPSLVTVLLLKLIISFKVFDLVFIMTSGGPGLDTSVASYTIYRSMLEEFDLGQAGAQTIIFLIVVTLFVLPISRIRQRLQGGTA